MTLRRQTVPPPVPRRPGTRVWNVALKYTRYLRGLVAAPDRAWRHPRHPDTQTSSYPSHDGGHSPRAGLSQKYLREEMRRLKIITRRRSSEAGDDRRRRSAAVGRWERVQSKDGGIARTGLEPCAGQARARIAPRRDGARKGGTWGYDEEQRWLLGCLWAEGGPAPRRGA